MNSSSIRGSEIFNSKDKGTDRKNIKFDLESLIAVLEDISETRGKISV